MASHRGSLPACPLCTEHLGIYGGPCTLPCGHNLCLHCASYLQQRQAQCPLCRAPFCPSLQLAINCELRELMRLAEALTAVEGEDGWQAVTTAARLDSCTNGKAGGDAPCGGGGSAVRLRPRVGVGEVVDGSGSVMELDPQPWEPDSSSAACRGTNCGRPFSFLLRPRHHCRCCGQLFCGACADDRLLLPPKFRLPEPERVCRACAELLLPIQPLLAGSIAPAVRAPVYDVYDWTAPRSLLNPPLSGRLETDIYTATNILRAYVKTVGSLPQERAIPSAILRGAAGLAILSVAKAGAGWSLSVGSGLVVARDPGGSGGWSPPSAILTLASSVGWQLGVEVQDLVLVLRNSAALRAFCSAQLGIGGGASVAAGPVGRAAAARALASVGAGAVVYSYSSTRGAYAGVALEALLISSRDAVNQAFYGRKLTARQLLVSGAVPPPPAAAALYSALDALMEHASECEAAMAGRGTHVRAAPPPAVAIPAAASLSAPAYPAAGHSRGHRGHSDSEEDEWEPEEEDAAPSAPAAPAPMMFLGGLGCYQGEASRGRAAPPPPAHPQAASVPARGSLYPRLDDEPPPYGSLFD